MSRALRFDHVAANAPSRQLRHSSTLIPAMRSSMFEERREDPPITRRGFVAAAASVAAAALLPVTPAPALAAAPPAVRPPDETGAAQIFDLAERSISELQTALGRGELTS